MRSPGDRQTFTEYFCKGFFNQDWDLWGPDAASVTRAFVSHSESAEVAAVRRFVNDLLGRGLTEVENKTELLAAGLSEYDPGHEQLTYTGWLKVVFRQLGSTP